MPLNMDYLIMEIKAFHFKAFGKKKLREQQLTQKMGAFPPT